MSDDMDHETFMGFVSDISWNSSDEDNERECEDGERSVLPGDIEPECEDGEPFVLSGDIGEEARCGKEDSEEEEDSPVPPPPPRDERARLRECGFADDQEPIAAERPLLVDETFDSWESFEKAKFEYEPKSNCRLLTVRKNLTVYCGRCKGHGPDHPCKVVVNVRCMKKSGLLTVRKCFLAHACPSYMHNKRNGNHRVKWITEQIEEYVRINPHIPIKQLTETLRTFHKSSAKKWSVQRARAACNAKIAGAGSRSFNLLPAYVEKLRRADPNCRVDLQTDNENRFVALFVSPGSSQHCFNYCLPLVGLDGTHISGQHPMILFLATCFDGENKIVILAWGLVPIENGPHWTWFGEHLRSIFPKMRAANTVFISDKGKGLKKAVDDVFPEQPHSECVQHIRMNIKGHFDDHCANFFIKVANAKTEQEYEGLLRGFKPEPRKEKQKGLVAYIRGIDPGVYARFAFPMPRYGHMTSNVVESMNAALMPCRSYSPLKLSEYLWDYQMVKVFHHWKHGQKLEWDRLAVTEFAAEKLKALYRDCRSCEILGSSMSKASVKEGQRKYEVDMDNKTCTCTDWHEYDRPCIHAILCINEMHRDMKEYVGDVWLAESFQNTYSVAISPVSLDTLDVNNTQVCLEPVVMRKPSKKKKSRRIPSWGEAAAMYNNREERKQNQKCGNCKKPGHNCRACPDLTEAPAIPNGRGAPTVVVGSEQSVIRQPDQPFQIYATRPLPQSYAEFRDSQAGSSQVSQM